jgi:hypothetical protein
VFQQLRDVEHLEIVLPGSKSFRNALTAGKSNIRPPGSILRKILWLQRGFRRRRRVWLGEFRFDRKQSAISRREKYIEIGICAADSGWHVCLQSKRDERTRHLERCRKNTEVAFAPVIAPIARQRRR